MLIIVYISSFEVSYREFVMEIHFYLTLPALMIDSDCIISCDENEDILSNLQKENKICTRTEGSPVVVNLFTFSMNFQL